MAGVAIPYGTVEPWWRAVFECCVFGLAVLGVIEYVFSGLPLIRRLSLLTPLLALACFSFIQSLPLFRTTGIGNIVGPVWHSISADNYGTRRFLYELVALLLTGAMLLHYTSSRRRLQVLIHTVIAVSLASAVFGIVRQTAQHGPTFILPYLNAPGSYAQFISKHYFAYSMEMGLGLLAGLIVGGGVALNRILLYVTAAVIMWAALIMSDSRGGILAFGCQALFVVLLLRIVHRKRPDSDGNGSESLVEGGRSYILRGALIVCMLLALGFSIIWVGGEPLVGRLERAPNDFSQQGAEHHWNTSRKDIWRATWRMFRANPVVGTGFGGYWIAVTKYHSASGEYTPQQAHNDYLEALAGGGIVGTAFIVWFIVVFIKAASVQLRASDQFRRAACYGALTGLFGIAVHSLVDFGLHATVNALIFVALAVIATVELPGRRKSHERS